MSRHRSRGVSAAIRVVFAALLVGIAALFAPAARAATDLCGVTIVEDVNLDQDLVCAGAGITVGASGIRIHLQGHTITGPGAGTTVGIKIAGYSDVSILGGTITKFFAGVQTSNATDLEIKDMLITHNFDGVDLMGGTSDVQIKASRFVSNATRGIMVRGPVDDVDIKDNTFFDNRVSILLFAPTHATVKANSIDASRLAGIRINFPATSNLVLDNLLTANPAGIEFLAAPDGSGASGNTIKANTLSGNTCGFKGPGSANTFLANQFSGNTTDVCG